MAPPSSAPPTITHLPTLSLPLAQHAIAAAQSAAVHFSTPMNIAILDSTLHLLSFVRMPGAKLTSIDIAINKAFTAAGHRAPTANYKEAVWPGGKAFGIWNSNGGRFTVIAGGLPIKDSDGNVLGAIGCSSGTPDEDERVARAGVEAVAEVLRKADGPIKAKL